MGQYAEGGWISCHFNLWDFAPRKSIGSLCEKLKPLGNLSTARDRLTKHTPPLCSVRIQNIIPLGGLQP